MVPQKSAFTESGVGGDTSNKKMFFEITRKETSHKIGETSGKGIRFFADFSKNQISKAQQCTNLEGGVHSRPPPHLVVERGVSNYRGIFCDFQLSFGLGQKR